MRKTILFTVVAAAACGDARASLDVPAVRHVVSPAAPGSAQPFVASDGDRFLLSWTEPADGEHALRFAFFSADAWSAAGTVASGADWFVNWADFPSVVPVPNGHLAAHWLQRSGPGRYSYDVMLAQSADGGTTWSPPLRPHRDATETEHGFVSLFPAAAGLGAVWLDGRRFAAAPDAPPSQEMMLVSTTIAADGALSPEVVIDERICDCCQTGAALTERGVLVVYRDRSPEEVRDISYTTLVDGRWEAPRSVHEDGWVINACPVNGPAVDAAGERAVVAWFTGAHDMPRVNVAFSDDAGRTFGPPVRVDQGNPVGRVDILFVDDDRAFVVWLERSGDGAELRGRLISRSHGTMGAPASLAATSDGRSAGFPRMAAARGRVLLAWTETSDPQNVRTAIIDFDTQ
jgi:hypothetical protein